ncbi:Protein ASPARTIC PROTEASE IN GUARD CELL 1 [Linum perenne]
MGTPRQSMFMVMDIGSSLFWVRCARDCNNGKCEYFQRYADGSGSVGELAKETVSFKNQTHFHEMKNVVFGCGEIESPKRFRDRFGGILGLGPRFEFSMMKGSMFTYCLGDLKDDAHNSHYIILMDDVRSMNERSFNDFEKSLIDHQWCILYYHFD